MKLTQWVIIEKNVLNRISEELQNHCYKRLQAIWYTYYNHKKPVLQLFNQFYKKKYYRGFFKARFRYVYIK